MVKHLLWEVIYRDTMDEVRRDLRRRMRSAILRECFSSSVVQLDFDGRVVEVSPRYVDFSELRRRVKLRFSYSLSDGEFDEIFRDAIKDLLDEGLIVVKTEITNGGVRYLFGISRSGVIVFMNSIKGGGKVC